jgi:cobalt-zinc-cadmium efflux system membrane fusion protein
MTIFYDNILWAEFKIFPNQMRIIKKGQKVIIDNEVFSIAHIIPNQNNQPFELARVRLDNHDHGWRAGVTLKADVITQSKTANIRIPNEALQQFENKTVVFIKQGESYEPAPVTIGLRDNLYSEVLSGLNKGDEYVVTNSYLIKADLEKAGAEHVH